MYNALCTVDNPFLGKFGLTDQTIPTSQCCIMSEPGEPVISIHTSNTLYHKSCAKICQIIYVCTTVCVSLNIQFSMKHMTVVYM